MKIGIDCRLPFYQMGGISQYVLHLLPALAAADINNQYSVFRSWRDAKTYLPREAANFREKFLLTPSHHRLERWTLGLELLLQDIDIFHSVDFIPPAFGAARRVVTIHDLNFIHYPDFLTAESRRYYLDQIKWAVRESDHIIADSEHTRADLVNILGVAEEKITTIYLAANPIYTESRSPKELTSVLERYSLPSDFLLFVGTLSPRKNIELLLKVIDHLHDDFGVKAPLVLVGSSGWLAENLQIEIKRLEESSRALHLDRVSDYELSCLYHAAGVLALPSYYEGFGLPILEAMHCGCPVVSSNRGSLPEVVGHAGPLLEPDDVPSWIEAIMALLTDAQSRREAVNRGYAQAVSFTWQETARQTLTVYSQAAN